MTTENKRPQIFQMLDELEADPSSSVGFSPAVASATASGMRSAPQPFKATAAPHTHTKEDECPVPGCTMKMQPVEGEVGFKFYYCPVHSVAQPIPLEGA